MAGRFPFPLPNGWFSIAWSEDVKPGEVHRVAYLERELVLFRSESGVPYALDPYCPHLGAHLGHGGTVVGETIRCPFHAWRYDGTGACVEVPYAKKIPPTAKLRAWRVIERCDQIYVWYHAKDEPPFYEIPELPQFSSPEYVAPIHHEFTLRTAVQEMAENDHDSAHFATVHQGSYLETTVSYEGLTKKAVSASSWGDFEGPGAGMTLERINYGLGLATVEVRGVPGTGLIFLSSVTPIDADKVHARWLFTYTKGQDAAGRTFVEGIKEGVKQDIPIWENKVYRERPVLCDGDGPIAEFRKWAQNFY